MFTKSLRFILLPLGILFLAILSCYLPTAQLASASEFASSEEESLNLIPQVPAYKVKPDLSNVSNADDFNISPEVVPYLANNGFVVIQTRYSDLARNLADEFFPLYEENRYTLTPNFVTTDSILHNYHLMFDHLLKNLEETRLASELKKLNAGMLEVSLKQYEYFKGTEWENAAKRNVGFFAVGSKLLDPTVKIPALIKTEVEKEIKLIESHQGLEISPVMNIGAQYDVLNNLKEDYSQYIPRGHYDKSELLKAYFKSMMWYGRITFRLKYEDEVKSLMMITYAISEGDNLKSWETIYEPTQFFVGKSDDITYYQIKEILDKIYGESSWQSLPDDSHRFYEAIELMKKLEPPQINSIPIFAQNIQPDREVEIKGFRLMGQRFTLDASIFQRLIDREVPGRMLPKGLDIPSSMGSEEALEILKKEGATEFPNYMNNMTKLRNFIAGLDFKTWTQNLYWGWLYSLIPLITDKSEGYPSFMRNKAWIRKELNTYLGSWTELKHDTILYAKQAYAECGGDVPSYSKTDDRGYVEPNPQLYARLVLLLKMTREGLESRGLLSDKNKENLIRMETLAQSLKTISEKELQNILPTVDEFELIRSYGAQLEHIWLEINREDIEKTHVKWEGGKAEDYIGYYLDDNPAALVADVATDPNGSVLEEGTGRIMTIFAIVPVDGKLKLASGGVYSHYEFTWPMSDRLTDSSWRSLLYTDKRPSLHEWANDFISNGSIERKCYYEDEQE